MGSIYSKMNLNCFSFSSIFIFFLKRKKADFQTIKTINSSVLIFSSDSQLFNRTVIRGKIFQLLRTVT